MLNTVIVLMCYVLASTAFAAENVQVSQNCAQLALSTSHITVEWSNIKPYVYNSSSKKMQGKFLQCLFKNSYVSSPLILEVLNVSC